MAFWVTAKFGDMSESVSAYSAEDAAREARVLTERGGLNLRIVDSEFQSYTLWELDRSLRDAAARSA
jgi:hypothetical protein